MWPFKKKIEQSKTDISVKDTILHTSEMPKMLYKFSNVCGMYDNFTTVEIGLIDENSINGRSAVYNWQTISPKLKNKEAAEHWVKRFVDPDTLLGKKTAKFLHVLKDESTKNNIRWLCEYALAMFEYYSTCYVKNNSIFELKIAIQLDDMGDEISNCIFGTEKRLFNLRFSPDDATNPCKIRHIMEYIDKDETFNLYYRQGFEPRENASDRQFSHIGSNIKNLLSIHWKIDLNKIVL